MLDDENSVCVNYIKNAHDDIIRSIIFDKINKCIFTCSNDMNIKA